MSSISTAHLKTRPQRIAFLVDPNVPDAAATIFQIINFSNKCWGGGYYPILPTDGKKIDVRGQTWAETNHQFSKKIRYVFTPLILLPNALATPN